MDNNPLMPGRIIVAYDANKERNENEFKYTINGIRLRGDIIRGGDTIMVFGILHRVIHPFGYQMQASPEEFTGSNICIVEEEVSKRVDMHINMLLQSAKDCKDEGVDIEVKITAGTPIRKVVLQEAITCNATWLILDRHLRRDLQYYLKHIPCKVAVVLDNLTVEVLRPYTTNEKDNVEHEVVKSISKPVPLSSSQDKEDMQQSVITCKSYPVSTISSESSVILKSNSVSSFPYRSLDHSFSSNDDYSSTSKQDKSVVLDNLTVEVLRPYTTAEKDNVEHEVVKSISKPVPLSSSQDKEDIQQSVITCKSYPVSTISSESSVILKSNSVSSFPYRSLDHSFSSNDDYSSTSKQDKSGRHPRGENKYISSPVVHKHRKNFTRTRSSDAPFLCVACGIKTELYIKESMRFSYSEIQLATEDFSKENLLGEGGYGHVYKGVLNDGQFIAAKVRKETSTQGFKEFSSEVYVLSFARHKNIVMLLGYCCKENVNILVYEYICNKSLEWHLFDKTAKVLDWHQRRAIAIGTAKGLRFLHEECRGSPIIHRDLRPSNILLTHDFVPMLGDFGLAKWKTSGSPIQTRIVGTFGYLAPEYAENGVISVRTDVYAFGIVLIQLISGRTALDSDIEYQEISLRQWAEPLIERLALHELTDPRLGESYDTYELYHMARTAYLCLKTDPGMRPSMEEVVRLLEGENDHLHNLVEQFVPHFSK